MPFSLKNAGTTYQRLVDKAFDSQVGRNIKVCTCDHGIRVIQKLLRNDMRLANETFRTLRKINMKLNPKKYTFMAVEGMFLGYTITPEGIKPCLDKTKAVLQLPSPWTIKEVQSLNGKLANAEQAFKQLKQHLSELPLLVAPKPKEELIVYLSASHGAISAVLMTERGTVQTPVYFVSRALQGPELNYTPMEKLVLSLVFAAKRLRRTSVKGQILADFLVEKPDESPPDTSVVETPQEPWTLFTDGSSCVDGSGAGLILTSPEGTEFTYALRFQFTASNNEAEYEALIADLRIATHMGVRNVHTLTPITAPWLFYKWGIDIVGPFPEREGKVKFLIVAMDYFTKWIEAKAVSTITGNQVKKFVWDNIVCRFGLPGEIVSDNGKQFSDNPFLWNAYKELPHVLWAHRTTIKSSHGDTPFSLTYGTEAVIPAEIRMPTYRTTAVDAVHNDEELRLNLDLLEERRERAAIREAKAKLQMTKYYNARVRGVTFRPGDFVYRSNDASHAVAGGKLGPKWEGPYEVTEALGDGAYRLRSMDGTVLPRTWNIANLKKCYL
ncbi:reverse transcriptase domain-containing protein [Tanacetum coccineum]